MSNQYIFYWQRRSFELILCSSQKKTTIECGPNKMIQSSFLFAKVETSKKSMVSGFLSPISSDSQFLRTVKKVNFYKQSKNSPWPLHCGIFQALCIWGQCLHPHDCIFLIYLQFFLLIFTLNNIFMFSLISVVFLFSEKLDQFSKEAQFIPQSNERKPKEESKSSSEFRHLWGERVE